MILCRNGLIDKAVEIQLMETVAWATSIFKDLSISKKKKRSAKKGVTKQ